MKHVIYDSNKNTIRPVIQLGYNEETHMASLISSDANRALRLDDGKLYILYNTDHDIENLQDIARKFGLIEQNKEAANKMDIYLSLTKRALEGSSEEIQIGNVVLFMHSAGFRAPVSNEDITSVEGSEGSAHWSIDTWPADFGYQTMFLQKTQIGNEWIVYTPILADGTVKSVSDCNTYIGACAIESNPMEYDSEHDKIILGIADSEEEADVLIELLNEWEDNIMSASIGGTADSKALHDAIFEKAIENQDKDMETICHEAEIDTEEIVAVVNKIYPIFNCPAGNISTALGRLSRMLFHELWINIPKTSQSE